MDQKRNILLSFKLFPQKTRWFLEFEKKQTNKKKTKTKTKTDVGHKVTTKFDTGFGKVM